jgi:hypothetical protein
MSDELLRLCNETELHWIAKAQGLGRLRRGLPHNELVAIVSGEMEVEPRHLSHSNSTRKILALYIHNPAEFPPDPAYEHNWAKAFSQLPGCDGICTRYDCTEAMHYDCYLPNKESAGHGK